MTVAARAPVSQSSYSTFAADAVSGWKTGTQSVTVTATAGIGTGLTIYTSQDGGATWTPTVGATATLSVSAQGAHQIKYYAEDSLTTESDPRRPAGSTSTPWRRSRPTTTQTPR